MRLFIASILTLVIYVMICVCGQKGKEVPEVSQPAEMNKDYPTLQLHLQTTTPNPPYLYEVGDSTNTQNPTDK